MNVEYIADRVIGCTQAHIRALPLPARYTLATAVSRGWEVERRQWCWVLEHPRQLGQRITVDHGHLHWIPADNLKV